MTPEHIEVALTAIKVYAGLHPRPTQVTQQQAAEMLGISRHTVRRMIASGILRLNRCGLLSVTDIDKILATPKTTP